MMLYGDHWRQPAWSELLRPQDLDLGEKRHHRVIGVVTGLEMTQHILRLRALAITSMRMFAASSQAASRTPRLPLPRASDTV